MELFIRSQSHALGRKLIARRKTKPSTQRKLRRLFVRSRRRVIRYSLLTANLAMLAMVVFFVAKTPPDSQAVRQNATASTNSADVVAGPLDQVSSADIAVHVARVASLPEAVSVVNHADSVSAIEATAPADTSVVAKPQVISTALPSRKDIHTYTTVAGDTIGSIAAKFGVSSESIRWSNGLSGNTIGAGRQLVLPPAGVNGIVYVVKPGDTADTLARKYGTDKESLISFNDAEVTGLVAGEQILIPNGVIRAVAAPSYNYFSAIYGSNGYDYGWCTWWAAKRRADTGRPLPSNLGNASWWRGNAAGAGLRVDHSPEAGAVAYYSFVPGLGHVGFVEQVNPDGSIWISDMNYFGVNQIGGSTSAGGWGRTSYHLVAPDQFGQYLFIH